MEFTEITVTTYLPASGHNFWVGFFYSDLFNDVTSAEEIDKLIQVEPVVGWVLIAEDDEGKALPLTPSGPLLPGIYRQMTQDRQTARDAAHASAVDMFARRTAARTPSRPVGASQ